jgi:hypothetical protein
MFVRAAIDAVVSKPARTVEVAQEAGLTVTVSMSASGVVSPGVTSEETGHAEDEGA